MEKDVENARESWGRERNQLDASYFTDKTFLFYL